MARYIDVDKAVEEARLSYCKDCNSYNGVRCSACAFDDAMSYIEDAPTADVVEVVRCRNCKHAYFRYNCKDTLREIYACEKRPVGRTHKKVSGDFFCAHGERRDT